VKQLDFGIGFCKLEMEKKKALKNFVWGGVGWHLV
jgi:hypothetical protein